MTGARDAFVWDTTGPAYAAAADRVEWLQDAAGRERDHLLPSVVLGELTDLGLDGVASAFTVVDCDSFTELDDILAIAQWMRLLGASPQGGHNHGEVFVAHIASTRSDAVAIVDDRRARRTMSAEGSCSVHGVLWAISRGVVEGRVPQAGAYSGLCDALAGVTHPELGALRWPFSPGGYSGWYKQNRAELESSR